MPTEAYKIACMAFHIEYVIFRENIEDPFLHATKSFDAVITLFARAEMQMFDYEDCEEDKNETTIL